jgi:hypothetical protein
MSWSNPAKPEPKMYNYQPLLPIFDQKNKPHPANQSHPERVLFCYGDARRSVTGEVRRAKFSLLTLQNNHLDFLAGTKNSHFRAEKSESKTANISSLIADDPEPLSGHGIAGKFIKFIDQARKTLPPGRPRAVLAPPPGHKIYP